MSGLEELLVANGGTLLSFAIFIGERIIQAAKDRASEKKENADEMVRGYLEWLRKQDHESLVSIINSNQDELLASLLEQQIDIQEILHKTLELISSERDLKNQLEALNQSIYRRVLSSIPLNCRDFANMSLIARDAEVSELLKMDGDLIISGQPGSGKTFLLYNISRQLNAKFLVSHNEGDILSFLRFSNPPGVIIDDAHDFLEILSSLIHFRQETGREFRIIAVCWPFEEQDLMRVMHLGTKSIYRLPLLSANAIVQIIKERFETEGYTKIETWLIREIRQQAAGRPGLALRLIKLILEDRSLKSLRAGQAHFELVDRAFRVIEGIDSRQILAAFAVGGRTGMDKGNVSSVLGIPVLRITSILRTLATGGIIEETGKATLATIPDAFRQTLIKDIFLCGNALALDDQYWQLYHNAPNKESALFGLIGAIVKGAILAEDRLLTELRRIDSIKAWSRLAWVSPDWCRRVIEECPNSIEELADPALHHVPETAIPLLLRAAVGDSRSENAHPEAPIRKMGDWITHFSLHTRDAVIRRRLLLDATLLWLSQGGDQTVAWKVLPKCVSFNYESSETDPGEGRAVTLTFGLVSISELKEIGGFWDPIIKHANKFPPSNWEALKRAVHEWLHPFIPHVVPPEGFNEFAREKGMEVVRRLMQQPNLPRKALGHWAIEHEIIEELKGDPEFIIFCPPDRIRSSGKWKTTHRKYSEDANALGKKWATQDPEAIATKLSSFEKERRLFEINWPLMGRAICTSLAQHLDDLPTWIETFLRFEIEADYLFPLIRRGIVEKNPLADYWLSLALSSEKYRWNAISEILKNDDLSEKLFLEAWPYLEHYSKAIGGMALCADIAVSRLVALGDHDNRELLREVVISDFHSDKQPLLSHDQANWTKIFCRAIRGLEELNIHYFYDMEKLLQRVPEVKFTLAEELLKNANYISWVHDEPYRKLLSLMESEEKIQLLPLLENVHPTDFTSWLVADDLQIYRALLNNDKLRSHHLVPLMGKPSNPAWQAKALLALDSGYAPGKVAQAAIGNHWFISGSAVIFWQAWIDEYNLLSNSSDPRLKELGKIGKKFPESYLERARKEEKREAMYGISDEN